jgi:hypothetical protein
LSIQDRQTIILKILLILLLIYDIFFFSLILNLFFKPMVQHMPGLPPAGNMPRRMWEDNIKINVKNDRRFWSGLI